MTSSYNADWKCDCRRFEIIKQMIHLMDNVCIFLFAIYDMRYSCLHSVKAVTTRQRYFRKGFWKCMCQLRIYSLYFEKFKKYVSVLVLLRTQSYNYSSDYAHLLSIFQTDWSLIIYYTLNRKIGYL